MFSIIEINQDYDYIESVNYVKSFATKQEAEDYIEKAYDNNGKRYKDHDNYLKEYCETVDFNKLAESVEFYNSFIKRSNELIQTTFTYANFNMEKDKRAMLLNFLKDLYITSEEGRLNFIERNRYPNDFNPPYVKNLGSLFIVEIPKET